jgi:hypothetical protein
MVYMSQRVPKSVSLWPESLGHATTHYHVCYSRLRREYDVIEQAEGNDSQTGQSGIGSGTQFSQLNVSVIYNHKNCASYK